MPRNITLAVSRDGVSLGIALFGNFEMASVATLSVYADGRRIGMTYLACAPEGNQETPSRNFTFLLKLIIRSRGSRLSRIVYVSDAWKIEAAYLKNMLRHQHVDGQRIRIQRIVDYYYASLRLTTIAEALLMTSSQRTEWLKRVRTASGTWRLGPSDATYRRYAPAARNRFYQQRRRRDSETLPASLSAIHDLL